MAASVRQATPADAPALLDLFVAFAREESARDARHAFADDASERYRNDLREWLGSGAHAVFVSVEKEGLVGFVTAALWYPVPLYREGREVFVSEVYVRPEVRRGGVARQLVGAVQEWARSVGAARLRAVLLHANTPSQALWTSMGAEPLAHVYTLELGTPSCSASASAPLGFQQ